MELQLKKVCDRRDIVSFVQDIERYPCLYDKTSAEYANKVYNRRAWSTIAKKINTTIPDCRDKWRKIRISYMRSLRQEQSDKPPMRPYYLSEYLQFLKPFLHINARTSIQKGEQMDYDVADLKKQELITDSDSSDQFDIVIDEDEHNERLPFKDSHSIKEVPKEYVRQISKSNFVEEKQYTIKDYEKPYGNRGVESIRNNYSEDIESNPRKMFLLSLLSDIDCFTETEMRIFRREVIGVCDNIINTRSIKSRY